jgi:thymidylate synthase
MIDHEYKALLSRILDEGETRTDRTGVGTVSLFGAHITHDMRGSFPLLTLKKVNFDWVARELLWFLSGSQNVDGLGPAASLWRPWADPNGLVGPMYGAQWRGRSVGQGKDQIQQLLDAIKADPWSRRLVVSAWNPQDLPYMVLAPCHALFQLYVGAGEKGEPHFLDLNLYQRSADMCVGVPFNLASYGLLMEMIAAECGLVARNLRVSYGDSHVYLSHLAGAHTLLGRDPRPRPRLKIYAGRGMLGAHIEDFHIDDYNPHPFVPFEVAV